MKIKYDFISNSSSTSFVYISDADLTLEKFMQAVGIESNSPLVELFTELYYVLSSAINEGTKLTNTDELNQYIQESNSFTDKTITQLNDALKANKQIIHGRLNSESDAYESFLCCDIFEIESDDFIISAYDNYW